MMRGPSYDDYYISRKMSQMPTFMPPAGHAPPSYGRPPAGGYMQEPYGYDYMPRGYPPMGPPPPRMVPRSYDYDYGYGGGYGAGAGYGGAYGGGYGGGYVPPPRMSRYDSYLDDEPFMEPSTYVPRYRPRVPEPLDDMDYREKAHAPSARGLDGPEDSMALVPHRRRAQLESAVLPESSTPGESAGDRHLARLERRYPSLSEPQMLQDHVDKMRIKLKSLQFSLDPSGPVPDIIVGEKRRTGDQSESKYSRALDFAELPKLASRRQRYYPEDEHMKDNLRIKCLSHYKTTRTAADASRGGVAPDSSYSRYSAKSGAQWEEPDTVFGSQSDRKPFSKVETGSSFFSTYGYTNRRKDIVAEKVRDYYYFGDKAKPLTDGTATEDSEEKKERRKKKKSKEREVVAEIEAPPAAPAAPAAAPVTPSSLSEVESAPAPAAVESKASESEAAPVSEETVDDEKERKRLEKKKRKAEREAAAKAAMEAELAALAAAEAELARLEAESSAPATPAPAAAPAEVPAAAPAAPAEPAAEVKSESAAEK